MPPLSPESFDFDPEISWMMHCAEGPIPRSSAQAVVEFLGRETRPWQLRWQEDFQDIPQTTRQLGARLFDADVDDLSLTATTSTALTTIAQAYPWHEGDEVLVPLGEFPSNYWPWQALSSRHVRVREVPLWPGQKSASEAWLGIPPSATEDVEGRLLDAIGPGTRILAVSWVRFQDGLRLDLQRLADGCRQRQVDLVVDGIQGCGTLPVSVQGLAALACGGHKGLLAPQGQGMLWTSPAFRQKLAPAGSWLSVQDATDFSRPSTDFERLWNADGSRFELGVPNLLGCVALNESLRHLLAGDVASIHQHVRALQLQTLDALAVIPFWQREAERLTGLFATGKLGSILPLHHGQSHEGRGQQLLETLMEAAKEQGIYLSIREGYLRLAFHGWHHPQEVDRLIEVLRSGPKGFGA